MRDLAGLKAGPTARGRGKQGTKQYPHKTQSGSRSLQGPRPLPRAREAGESGGLQSRLHAEGRAVTSSKPAPEPQEDRNGDPEPKEALPRRERGPEDRKKVKREAAAAEVL